MSVADTTVVDAIGIDRETGECVLSVADALGWDDLPAHLAVLAAKLEAYRGFIASGELASKWPKAAGRGVRIDVVFSAPPPEAAEEALRAHDAALGASLPGLAVTWRSVDGERA